MIRDLDVLKAVLQLLLVIGGVFGVGLCACVWLGALLHVAPPIPAWLARNVAPSVLLGLSALCALAGGMWIRADRRVERDARRRMPAPQATRSADAFSAFELKPGARYRVTTAFVDFDGRQHPVGESWRYLSRNFLPYDAGLTLNVAEAGSMSCIRMQAYPEAQGPVIDRFHEHVQEEQPSDAAEG